MKEIKGTFNIGGTWSETFKDENEFEYCMNKIRKNPCISWSEIIIDNKTYIKREDDIHGGGYNYIINHDIDAPEYILNYFKDYGLIY